MSAVRRRLRLRLASELRRSCGFASFDRDYADTGSLCDVFRRLRPTRTMGRMYYAMIIRRYTCRMVRCCQ